MSKTSSFIAKTRFGLLSTALPVFSAILLTIAFTGVVLAEDGPATAHRRIQVTCELNENQPVGTLVTRLQDHSRTLRNFRPAETHGSAAFRLDSDDGSVCIDCSDQINFEQNQEIRFVVLADDVMPVQDHFMTEFSAGLIEEGLTESSVLALSTVTVTFEILVRLREIPEPPELSDSNLLFPIAQDSNSPTKRNSPPALSRQRHCSEGVLSQAASLPFELPFGRKSDSQRRSVPFECMNVSNDDDQIIKPITNAAAQVSPVQQTSNSAGSHAVNSFPNSAGLMLIVVSGIVAIAVRKRVNKIRVSVDEEIANTENVQAVCPLEAPTPTMDANHQIVPSPAEEQLLKRIVQLQEHLESRDQLIDQLRNELRAVNCGSDQMTMSDSNEEFVLHTGPGKNPRATEDCESALCVVLSSHDVKRSVSYADARFNLTTARTEIERHLTSPALTGPSHNCSEQPEAVFSGESAAATLDQPNFQLREIIDESAMQHGDKPTLSTEHPAPDIKPASMSSETTDQSSQGSHLDSLQLYLSKLLERSRDARPPESILVDRRKTESSRTGVNRRATLEATEKPVKSYLESSTTTHGGEIPVTHDGVPENKLVEQPVQPPKPRKPIDAKSFRESMNSFRSVAAQSAENAILSHDRRQTKGKLAGRTNLIAGLGTVTGLLLLANMLQVIQIGMLTWLMVCSFGLSLIELCLRMYGIRKQRMSLTSSWSSERAEKQKPAGSGIDEPTAFMSTL